MTFLDVWVGYAIFGTAAFSAMFLWAVRNRQFSDLDRARHIALKAAEPIEDDNRDRKASRADVWSLVALALITVGVLTSAIWIGLRNL